MLNLPLMDGPRIEQLAREIEHNGFAELKGAVPFETLEQLRGDVRARTAAHQGAYFVYHCEEAGRQDSALGKVAQDPDLTGLLAALYPLAGAQRPAGPVPVMAALRCLRGESCPQASNYYHYDGSVVTALLPVEIPQAGIANGELVMFPNRRRIPRSPVLNMLQKGLVQNRIARRVLSFAVRRGWIRPEKILIQPGSLYFFWGYRSLHANLPCGPGQQRATAVFHFGDPHRGTWPARLILKFNDRRLRRLGG